MPVEVTRLEDGLYQAKWLGVVKIDEVYTAMQEIKETSMQHDEAHNVVVIDMLSCTRPPTDLFNGQRISEMDPRNVGFVMVGASKIIEVLGNMLKRMSSRFYFEFAQSVDEGVLHARKRLTDVQKETNEQD